MTVHIELVSPHTLCGENGDRINLRFIVRHERMVMVLMRALGCKQCLFDLATVMSTARPIN